MNLGHTREDLAALAAQIGAGSHVHCALNLFYQMDHMVVGAFRLFANLMTPSGRK